MSFTPFDPLAQVTDLRTAGLLSTGVAAGDPKQPTEPGRSIHTADARTEGSAS
jgi:hypothetical protein